MPLLESIYALERGRKVQIRPFFQSTSFNSGSPAGVVTLAATVAQTIQINSDGDFVARYLMMTVYNSPNILILTSLAALTIQLTDQSSGYNLFDNPQPVQNVCGGSPGSLAGVGGSSPFIFPEPWLIRAGGAIQVTITNLGQLTFPRVDVSLPGFKVKPFGGAGTVGSMIG